MVYRDKQGNLVEEQTQFNGGMLNDVREQTLNGFQLSSHFDVFTNPKRITPLRNSEANETKSQKIVRFLYEGGPKLYGYGVASGNNRPAIYYKASNAITDAWTAPTDNEASSGTDRNVHAFFHYKNYIYGWMDGTTLWRYGDITGVPAFTEAYQSIGYDFVAQPVRHPATDIAYFFTNNKVHKLDNVTFSSTVLTLPDNLRIMDAEPVGNFLALACRDLNPGSKSVVYLWDQNTTDVTFSNRIDWGEGTLAYLAYLDGRLIGITDYFIQNTTLNVNGGKIIIKVANGDTADTLREYQKTDVGTMSFGLNTGLGSDGMTVSDTSPRTKIIRDNKIYFPLFLVDQLDNFGGVGVVTSDGRMALHVVEEETTSSLQGFFLLGNNWFVAHSADGSVNRTDDGNTYTYTSTLQSQKFAGVGTHQTKKLVAATVTFAPLPAPATIVLQYRADVDTTWTTIFSYSVDNSIRHTATNIESTGVTLPTYKEIQFRIKSTGGGEPTGLRIKSIEVDDDIA